MIEGMSLGIAPPRGLIGSSAAFCEGRVGENSIYALLHREGGRLFSDELFADLFTGVGRRSVPPSIVAVVMVLQRIEGCSDREAVDRFAYDLRWKYAAGGLDYDYPSFVHTVLVDMRARLAVSDRPDRIFEVVLDVCRQAGLVGRRRVLDSTALYDAVATMDTVTLVRSAIRGLLAVCDGALERELRALLARDDDYASAGKPVCDYEDPAAREALIDALARDAYALLGALEGRELDDAVAQAVALLATVVGQDLQRGADGSFVIVRGVARDRVISTVDPEARHGHKTRNRGFDGYKGHVAVDPDNEIITNTTVTAGNVGDGAAALELLTDELAAPDETPPQADDQTADDDAPLAVYGDSAYGAGAVLAALDGANAQIMCKIQAPNNSDGRYGRDAFQIDIAAGTVTCPAGQTAIFGALHRDGGRTARFGDCAGCPLASACTTSPAGRSIHIDAHEPVRAKARAQQADPAWQQDYKATRPTVERKLSHLMRRKHGGRRARMRGTSKIDADFRLLASAANLQRLAILGLTGRAGRIWSIKTA
jgi:hypothetical protein